MDLQNMNSIISYWDYSVGKVQKIPISCGPFLSDRPNFYPHLLLLYFSNSKLQLSLKPKGIFNRFSIFLYCLDSKQWYLSFTYLFLQIHFPIYSLSFSPSHLNIISSIIHYSFFNHHLFFLYSSPKIVFFNKKCYVYNIFRNTFTTKFMRKVFTSSNLNPPLKLFFYSPILILTNIN